MKVKLSDKACNALIALHQLYGSDASISHYLNTLITDYQSIKESIPAQEDH